MARKRLIATPASTTSAWLKPRDAQIRDTSGNANVQVRFAVAFVVMGLISFALFASFFGLIAGFVGAFLVGSRNVVTRRDSKWFYSMGATLAFVPIASIGFMFSISGIVVVAYLVVLFLIWGLL